MNLEQSVCGFKEPLYFWLWSTFAGRPNSKRLSGLPNVVDISFTTADGRTLHGYKLTADTGAAIPHASPAGFLLVLPGNAMLADQIIGEFRAYAQRGYDVFIYDYRGYGRSEGKRRLKAIVHDTREILRDLTAQGYPRRLVYAMSLGGVFLLNALEPDIQLDRVVIDSTPSRLSNHGCPPEYDPVANLPADSGRVLYLRGGNDQVVSPAMSAELAREAEHRGATVIDDPQFGHPFMDAGAMIHLRRMQQIQRYLIP